jgi:prepilin-type N-terminal cleavage/methylation domain-containing protein
MNKSGFSIIESIISMVLLSICVTGGMAYYFNASKIMALATDKKIAMEIANEDLEKIREGGYDQLNAVVANESIVYGNFTADIQRSVTDIETNGGIPPKIHKQVTIDVSWPNESGGGQPRTITLVTSIAP